MSRGVARAVTRRPPEAWTLACLFLGGALGCWLGALVPYSPEAPVGLLRAVGATSAALAALAYLAGERLPRWSVHALLVVASLLVGLLIDRSATASGAVVNAYACFWIGTYAAYFLPRREAVAHAAQISAVLAVALVRSEAPALIPWTVVSASLAAGTLVLGNLVRRLTDQATHDQLTGLLNRHGMRQAAGRELALAGRAGSPLSVVLIDLDDFKQVNDRLGHAAGDRLLRRFAQDVLAQLRVSDIVGREGGDEFVIVLPATSRPEAEAVVRRLRPGGHVVWSAGTAEWRPGEDFDTCLGRADSALYAAKGAGDREPARTGPRGRLARRAPWSSR